MTREEEITKYSILDEQLVDAMIANDTKRIAKVQREIEIFAEQSRWIDFSPTPFVTKYVSEKGPQVVNMPTFSSHLKGNR